MTLQMRYRAMKQQKSQRSNFINVRMTNAQIHADNHVKQKITPAEAREQFKLKRFKEVEPRTSTKRGQTAFMSQIKKP